MQVRERGVALRKSIEELIHILQFQPHLLTWSVLLLQNPSLWFQIPLHDHILQFPLGHLKFNIIPEAH